MSTKLELSDHLIHEAVSAGAKAKRDPAGQVEFWASLGKAIDSILSNDQVEALRQADQERADLLQEWESLLKQLSTVGPILSRDESKVLSRAGLSEPTIESLLSSTQAARIQLEQNSSRQGEESKGQMLADLLDQVDQEDGRERLAAHLAELPFPHYEPYPEDPNLMIRVEADGTRTVGRFVRRVFTPAENG